jgi:hypothetical protein
MIMRWISEVPSKIVKILAIVAVYAGQRPAAPVVSARIQHAPPEMNAGARLILARCRTHSAGDFDAVRHRRGCGEIVLGGAPPAFSAQVYRRYIIALSCRYTRWSTCR